MKKIFAIALVAIMALGVNFKANAIENPFEEGTFILGANLGLGNDFGANVTGDYVLVNEWWKGHFTVGGYIGFNQDRYGKYKNHGYKSWSQDNYFYLMPRASYGLNITSEFEVHAGFMTGVYYNQWASKDNEGTVIRDSDYNGLHYDFAAPFIGCRYFFADNVAANAEITYGSWMPYLNIGLAFKF